jgi:hypothetical protein
MKRVVLLSSRVVRSYCIVVLIHPANASSLSSKFVADNKLLLLIDV